MDANDAHKPVEIAKLIAGISAVWSLESMPEGCAGANPVKPHSIQVLSSFYLLGLHKHGIFLIGDSFKAMKGYAGQPLDQSRLLQVKTGEGKSVLLGVLATTLAMTGCEVECVCYSKYLSERDNKAFAEVFKVLECHDSIKYGTFRELSERAINSQGNVREMAEKMVVRQKCASAVGDAKRHSKPRILLVDEVDKSQASKMVRNAQSVRDGTCVSYDGKIGYKSLDTIETNTSYAYETLFASMKENTAAQPVAIDCALNRPCGKFSLRRRALARTRRSLASPERSTASASSRRRSSRTALVSPKRQRLRPFTATVVSLSARTRTSMLRKTLATGSGRWPIKPR